MSKVPRALAGPLAFVAAMGVAACDSDGVSEPASRDAPSTGTVGVLLTDAPTDRFDRIYLNLTGIHLIPTDDSGEPVALFEGETSVDLMRLAAVAELFTVRDDIPTGEYSGIRLDSPTARLVDDDPPDGDEPREISAEIPGKGVTITSRDSLVVASGDALVVEIDIDARRSMLTEQSDGVWLLHPMVFLRQLDGLDPKRLVRIHGAVREVDISSRLLQLCQPLTDTGSRQTPDLEDTRLGCIEVEAGADTGIFNASHRPEEFSSVERGDTISAIGFIRSGRPDTARIAGQSPWLTAQYRLEAVVLRLESAIADDRFGTMADSMARSEDVANGP